MLMRALSITAVGLALCQPLAASAQAQTPLERQLEQERVQRQFDRSLTPPLAPIRPGGDILPSRAASAERLFRLGLKEGDTLLKACLAAAASTGVSQVSARPTCACGLRVTESTLTRAEFDTYTDWQVQTRTWRRFVFFWKPPPSEIIARLERASRQCAKPAR